MLNEDYAVIEDASSGEEVHILDYWWVIVRHKLIVASVFLVTLGMAAFYIKRQPPIYSSEVKIVVDPSSAQRAVMNSVSGESYWSMEKELQTQAEIVQTDSVLGKAVSRLELTQSRSDSPEFRRAISGVRGSMAVEFVKNTKMMKITMTRNNAQEAADLANAVAEAFIEEDLKSRMEAGRKTVSWLNEELASTRETVETAEQKFQDFKTTERIVSFEDKRVELQQEINAISSEKISISTDALKMETLLAAAEKSGSLDLSNIGYDSPLVQDLAKTEIDYQEKLKIYKPGFPEMLETKSRMDALKNKVVDEIRGRLKGLKAQEATLTLVFDAKKNDLIALQEKEFQYRVLERDVQTSKELYDLLMKKVKEISLVDEAVMGSLRIVEPAKPSLGSKGNPTMKLIVAAMAGLALGMGCAFFLDYMDRSIRTPLDVTRHLKTGVLALVPAIREAGGKKETRSFPVVVRDTPRSNASEAYRMLRTNVTFAMPNKNVRSLVVTSTSPREGKSLTVTNLASVWAQSGQKVLAIDSDMRRPVLHRAFGISRAKGLTGALSGEIRFEDACIAANVENLWVMPSGTLPSNPAELLGSEKMKELLNWATQNFDMVILDSPPVTMVTDAAVVAPQVDGVILVVRVGEVTKDPVKHSVQIIQGVRANLLGVVLNNIDFGRGDYSYYYYSKYYYYKYDYQYGEDKPKKKSRSRRGSSGGGSILGSAGKDKA